VLYDRVQRIDESILSGNRKSAKVTIEIKTPSEKPEDGSSSKEI
jgi:hypothetical protein